MALYQSEAEIGASNPDRLRDGPPKEAPEALYGDDYSDLGALLTASPERAAAIVSRKWKAQDEIMNQRLVRWRVNRMRRQGVPNVFAITSNGGVWSVWVSPKFKGPEVTPRPNVIADADRSFVSFLLADPPAPQVDPPSGEDEDTEAAEIATRILIEQEGEAGLRRTQKVRHALDVACDHGSGFEHFYVEPQAVRIPIRIKAGFDHTTGGRATYVGANGDPGDSLADPQTGMPWPSFERRYVKADGTLTDDEDQAATKWGPKLCSEILTGRNVRLLPHTATDVWDASGIMLASFDTRGTLKSRYRGEDGESLLDAIPEEMWEKILRYRPDQKLDILPTGYTRKDLEPTEDKDETLVFWQILYHAVCPEYPQGAYVVVLGDAWAIVQEPWTAQVKGGESERTLDLLLPVTQYAQFAEGGDDPYRVGLTQLVGGLGEGMAALWAMVWDNAEKIAKRKIFIDTTSNLKPHQLAQPGHSIIPIRNGSAPSYEEIPPLPAEIPDLMERVQAAIDNTAGLNDTTNGLENENVQSGRQAYAIIGQAHGRVSEIAQNVEAGYVRGCRIEMQLLAAHFEDEQVVSWKGEGEYRTAYWRGADLSSDHDIILNPATLSMMTPAAKEGLMRDYYSLELFPAYEMREMARTNVGSRIGMEDNKHLLRVRGQCAQYMQGPPKGWQPETVDPMTGAPKADDLLSSLWFPVRADEVPENAIVRLTELCKVQAGRKHLAFPPTWRAGLDGEVERMWAIVYPPQVFQQPGVPHPAQSAPQQEAPQPVAQTPLPAGMGGELSQPVTQEVQRDAFAPQIAPLAVMA